MTLQGLDRTWEVALRGTAILADACLHLTRTRGQASADIGGREVLSTPMTERADRVG